MKRTVLAAGLILCGLVSLGFAGRLWSWVLNFDPSISFTHKAIATGPPLSSGVTILLVDGLRLDASRDMGTLNELRDRGADIEATVGTPSFSRPGRATIAVGAPPSIHGVTTNRQKRALVIDNLLRRVGDLGGTCRVAGSQIWSGLFGADIARCGVYRADEGKEGPGAFVRQVPQVRASQDAGISFVLEKQATLRIADILSTDFAGHEYGGVSAEYHAEVVRADAAIARVVSELDLSRETLVVTADHGHRDAGGHGGEEPEVLRIPIVMVGAGIRPGTVATATQADIAPTVAALLGLGLPEGSSGHPIESVLAADALKLALVRDAAARQAEAFDVAVADRLGIRAGSEDDRGWTALIQAYREAALRGRTPLAIVLALLSLLGIGGAIWSARPRVPEMVAGLMLAGAAAAGALRALAPPMTFSAINYDELLIPFFVRVISLAMLTTLFALGAALLSGRLLGRGALDRTSITLTLATGLVLSLVLGSGAAAAWLHHGLLLPLSIPGSDRMVEAFAMTVSTTSVAVSTLAVAGALRAGLTREGSE